MPVSRKEKPVEASRHGEEFLLCARLWESIANHLKVLYKMSSVLMSWPSGIFQGWSFPFVLCFCLLCMRCQKKLLGGAKAALALSEHCPPACLEPRPVSGQTEEHAQTDQVQAVSRTPGTTWKAASWHPHSVQSPHIVWHCHTPCDTNYGDQGSRASVHSWPLQSPR